MRKHILHFTDFPVVLFSTLVGAFIGMLITIESFQFYIPFTFIGSILSMFFVWFKRWKGWKQLEEFKRDWTEKDREYFELYGGKWLLEDGQIINIERKTNGNFE